MTPSAPTGCSLDTPGRYRILGRGTLDAGWTERIGGMTLSPTVLADHTPATTLLGVLADQSALVGVLSALLDLGLPLVSVEQIMDESQNQ